MEKKKIFSCKYVVNIYSNDFGGGFKYKWINQKFIYEVSQLFSKQ